MAEMSKAEKKAFAMGVLFASEIADSYNSSTTHPYMLGDCILAKLNMTKRKPRRNKQRLKLR